MKKIQAALLTSVLLFTTSANAGTCPNLTGHYFICAPSVFLATTDIDISQTGKNGITSFTFEERSQFSEPTDSRIVSNFITDGKPHLSTVYDPMDGSPGIKSITASCSAKKLIIKEKTPVTNLRYEIYRSGDRVVKKIKGMFSFTKVNDTLICQ